jgi:16S rRNA (uracil1498-N3)-methyltransferase
LSDRNEKLRLFPRWSIIFQVVRRIHVLALHPGEVPLDAAEAHHALEVLRLTSGTTVEVFDDDGHVAPGVLSVVAAGVFVRINTVQESRHSAAVRLTVAAAVPKGDRVDWMIQKLSELGVYRFIPLVTARSVVVPAGKNKAERWARLAVEAAKQSRRPGVMKIASLARPEELITSLQVSGQLPDPLWYLSLHVGARSIVQLLRDEALPTQLTLMVGPEGGWTEEEMGIFEETGVQAVALTSTVLRIETAAIAAAAVVACWQS